ncbi:MAG TPA: DUF420 domain-containing protein, partial [Polyangiaceae bacterium]
ALPTRLVPGEPTPLATLNAVLNAGSAVFLSTGYVFIRRRNVDAHRRCMLTAFVLSSAFLVSYLVHHSRVGSVPFRGTGPLRFIYFSILVPHVTLAIAIVPMALLTIYRGLTQRFALHRKIARWTLPIWLYVSISGVVVYLMLYG